jgi:glycosyltransferase involved in cell wall biosynthesis
MNFRYLISTPFAVNPGGTTQHGKALIEEIAKQGYEIKPLDFVATKIDFDVLLVVSFSYHNPDMLEKYREAGVKIVLVPIFDRTKPKWTFTVYKTFEKTPIRTLFNIRKRILDSAHIIMCGCEEEKTELTECFGTDNSKIKVNHLGINSLLLDLDKSVSEELFYNKYGIKDFVIFAAAEINKRKNQLALVKALEGTDIKVVLTGCNKILVEGFQAVVDSNPNILCLGSISYEELVSAYKCAKVSVSLSSSETAGLALLESAYFGCNIVASKIPSFVEYIGGTAVFLETTDQITKFHPSGKYIAKDTIDAKLPEVAKAEIVTKINEALAKPKNDYKQYIIDSHSWTKHVRDMISWIG